jgi:HlyD family secretion protein
MDAAEASYLSAKTDLITAEASLAQAKSTLDLSKVDLSYSVIRAPVDGVVISRKINVGQTVQSSFQAPVLFQIATDLTKMKVECSVDESDIGKVKEGQKARFTVEAYQNETFQGVVQQVRFSPETVQNVVTYTTIVNLENPQKKLFPGMTATVSIIVGEAKDVLRVPNAALRFTPTLTQPEMEKMLQEMRDRLMAGRPGQEGQPAGAPAAAGEQARPRGEGRPQGQGGQFAGALAQGGAASGQAGRTRQQQMPRVWTLGEDGKLSMQFLRTGVTDNSYTEILRSELKEGDEVLIGTESAASRASTSPQPGMQMMFMGGPRR